MPEITVIEPGNTSEPEIETEEMTWETLQQELRARFDSLESNLLQRLNEAQRTANEELLTMLRTVMENNSSMMSQLTEQSKTSAELAGLLTLKASESMTRSPTTPLSDESQTEPLAGDVVTAVVVPEHVPETPQESVAARRKLRRL